MLDINIDFALKMTSEKNRREDSSIKSKSNGRNKINSLTEKKKSMLVTLIIKYFFCDGLFSATSQTFTSHLKLN